MSIREQENDGLVVERIRGKIPSTRIHGIRGKRTGCENENESVENVPEEGIYFRPTYACDTPHRRLMSSSSRALRMGHPSQSPSRQRTRSETQVD